MKPYLICIDSDGCVFDTMEIKHKECFCPPYIRFFSLQSVSKYAREAWEFSNLYSKTRGIHRLKSLLLSLDLLTERKEVKERGAIIPTLPTLRKYVAEGNALSNGGIAKFIEENPDSEEMKNVLEWSLEVNRLVEETVKGVPPFPHVAECLKEASVWADIVIVSATEEKALAREWEEHGLLSYVTLLKGQESGTKKEIIASLKNAYGEDRVLMLGDAPGDRDAAHQNGALFYPICPGEEEKSWENFPETAKAFREGNYRGEKEEKAIARFETLLPEEPAWN